MDSYLSLNRLKEAQATAKEMQAKSLDSSNLSFTLYALAFLQNDAEGMAQQVAWSAGKPGVEDALLGISRRGIVRPQFTSALLAHRLAESPGYYGEMVWILMMLELWLRAEAETPPSGT